MPISPSAKYMYRVNLPHGPVLNMLNSIRVRPGDENGTKFIMDEIRKIWSTNPDAELVEESIMVLPDNGWEKFMQEEAEKLRAETGKPLANELGLDTPQRLLANPQVSRGLAAQNTPG